MRGQHLVGIFFWLYLHQYHKVTNATKWLIENPGFDDPAAWIDDYLPCAREKVIFPETYNGLLPLPSTVDVGGFILPRDGAIFLQRETTITLEGNSKKRDCDKGKAYLKKPTIHKWFDPKTWRSSKEFQANKAIPDMERVPCNNESVVIQSKGPLAFDLENVAYLRMGQISISGSLLARDYMKQLLYSDLGQFMFKNQYGVNIEYYHHDVCGCHKDFSGLNESICHNIAPTCTKPHCLQPIRPLGSCCDICGAVIRFQVDYCENARLHTLKNILEKAIKDQDLRDDVDFYVNYENSQNYGNFLQAIVVDRDGYSEKSIQFLKKLNESINWSSKLRLDRGKIFAIDYAGRPYNPNVTFGSMILILLCLMFVSVVALVIFAHYNPDNLYLRHIPRWVYDPRLWRSLFQQRDAVFARFDNTRASIITTTDMGRTSQFTMDPSDDGEGRKRAFDNPLFGEKPSTSKHVAQEEKFEEKPEVLKEIPQLIMESVDMVDNDTAHKEEEEQELTEIRLESSSDEDDDKQEETKE
ncbi:amnion associated transmembrane protein [Haematobia irritans]|uniref:amnion associated transmembrane protein n=1 Tax=Haematobia irritans TaxID=7368 RepID=UPI003F5084E5